MPDRSPLLVRMACVALACLAAATARAQETADFERDVRPLLSEFCFDCHAADVRKGDVDLERFASDAGDVAHPGLLKKVKDRLDAQAMPPKDKEQPSAEQRAVLDRWLDATLARARAEAAEHRSPTPLRRLSRGEIDRSLRDLLDLPDDLHPAAGLPRDGSGGEGFDNAADVLFCSPMWLEQCLDAAELALASAPDSALVPEGGAFDRDAALCGIERFCARAFRRPPEAADLAPYVDAFDRASAGGDAVVPALRVALRGALVAPQFLMRIERDRPGEPVFAVDDFELATRMSYFLWSSLPDAALSARAARGELASDLAGETRRMIADLKSRALAQEFAAQWLGFRSLRSTSAPDPGRFPTYTDSLRDAMIEEAELLFDSVLREDRSTLALIDADYTFVNEELAAHYGIAGVRGAEMRRVPVADARRGGVLALAATLTATSYPLRTSPVARGKWILNELLGSPPPPPPPSAGILPADDAQKDGQSLRARLEAHRKDASCASCHARMDPLGFALENYDAIGRWRDAALGQPLDVTGTLPDGTRLYGPAGLKRALLANPEAFLRVLARKLFGYAMGRAVEPSDEPALDGIVASTRAQGDRLSAMVVAVVASAPFRERVVERAEAPR